MKRLSLPERLRSWWATPLVGIGGALLAAWWNWPLPWIIGSMLAVILVRCGGWKVAEIPNGRISGQWIIATSIGLHLTQSVALEIARHFPLMLGVSLLTLGLALLGIALMKRLGMDLTTAYFAFMPANFAEMINLGIRYKADVSRIAAAHSIRLVLIVLCVPPALFFSAHLPRDVIAVPLPVDWSWLAPMLAGGWVTARLWKRLKLPNPWMFGPMLTCSVITAGFDLHLALPSQLSHYGQLMIGCALGCFFDRTFFRSAPRYLLKVALFTLSLILCTFAFALLIGAFVDLPVLTLALGMMPGSTTEMYLTAEALHLGAGIVTAMQIMRLVVIMLCAEPIYRYWARRCAN